MNRFHEAGLWANPFDSLVPALVGYQPPPALRSFVEGDGPLLVVRGASGYGKSTALAFVAHELQRQSREANVVYITPGGRRPAMALPRGGALLVDEANRLWPWEIMRLVRLARVHGCRLALAAHRPDDLWLCRAPGRRPLVLARWRDPSILPAIFEARARYVQTGSRMDCRPDPAIWPAAIEEGGGTPGRTLRFLYWLVELCADPRRPARTDLPAARTALRTLEPRPPSLLERLGEWWPA